MSSPKYVLIARIPAEGVSAYQEYETAVLPLLCEHEGTLERRLRSSDGLVEVHVVGFSSHAAFRAYMEDPRRVALQPLLASSGASAELHELVDVDGSPGAPWGPSI
ncbi:MAG TPA: hypothetical protein VK781_00935 [Solirubrobacteraceae bacterium]|nr:hypothetical protein [Solirubrobacteraceae bacterium]